MKIGFIGCGNLGTSLAKRLALAHELYIYEKNQERLTFYHKFPKITICSDPKEVATHSEMILLLVKPDDLKIVIEELKNHIQSHHFLVSVLMGISIQRLKESFGSKIHVVRMMPNLAVEYGEGVSAFCSDPPISKEMKETISQAFSSTGLNLWLPEDKIDAINALSASGPAFVLIFLEAMIDAGILLGLYSEDARKIAMQTMRGALAMMEHSGKHPGELRWLVSSPGGSTINGTHAMEQAGVRAGVMDTFLATYKRTKI